MTSTISPIRVFVARSIDPNQNNRLVMPLPSSAESLVMCDVVDHQPVMQLTVELYTAGILSYAAEIEQSIRNYIGQFAIAQLTGAQRAELSAEAYVIADTLHRMAARFPIGCPVIIRDDMLLVDSGDE